MITYYKRVIRSLMVLNLIELNLTSLGFEAQLVL